MRRDALIQWLHEGNILAGKLSASEADHTAWIGIYPLRLDRQGTREVLMRAGITLFPGADVHVYRIRTFELADSVREAFFGESDLKRGTSAIVIGDDALFAKLSEMNIGLEMLDSPRLIDYPM